MNLVFLSWFASSDDIPYRLFFPFFAGKKSHATALHSFLPFEGVALTHSAALLGDENVTSLVNTNVPSLLINVPSSIRLFRALIEDDRHDFLGFRLAVEPAFTKNRFSSRYSP